MNKTINAIIDATLIEVGKKEIDASQIDNLAVLKYLGLGVDDLPKIKKGLRLWKN